MKLTVEAGGIGGCLLYTSLSGMNSPRYMNCNDIVDSFSKEVKIMTFADLDIPAENVGLAGSPTKVHHTCLLYTSRCV